MAFIDLTGKIFGKLKVLKLDEDKSKEKGRTYWICQCSCKNKTILSIRADALGKRTFSCGCYQKEQAEKHCKDNYKQYNTYDLSGDYGIGWTNKNEEFWFDLEDYNKIKNYCWNVAHTGYLQARDGNTTVLMHRIIFMEKYPDGNFTIDHIGHNTLDMRKPKLRVTEQKYNCMNKMRQENNTSGIIGVYWDKSKNKWVAQIGVDYKNIHLGRFTNIEDAIAARKAAEEKYFGEYSYDNSMKLYTSDVPDIEEQEELTKEEVTEE